MAVASRRISVIVEGNSSSAQKAMAKAAESMNKLGEIVVKQSNLAIEYDKKVIASNDAVMASYDRMLSTITRASDGVDTAISTQTRAQERLAESAGISSDTVSAAAEKQAAAVRDTTTIFDEAVSAQIAGLDKVAAAAIATADSMIAAAEKQAAAVSAAADKQIAVQKRASDAAVSSATKQNASFNTTGAAMSKFGKGTTLAALGIGAASVYMASKFEQSTTRLTTQAGATTKQVHEMRGSLLSMAGEVGQSPEHLSESFYHVVSAMNAVLPAAHRTTEELQIQKVAAEGAAVGHTNLEETTYALSSAMNALHLNAGQAEQTMGTLNAIVGAGDMTMTDLLDAMKSGLIPTARSFGISLESVGSALAVMGDQGMRGALAGTRLRMSIALLAAPSAKAAEMLHAIGLSGGEITTRTKAMSKALEAAGLTTTKMAEDVRKPNGLTIAFRDLTEHLKASGMSATDTAALLSRAFGGGRMGSTIMLLSQSVDRLDAKYKQIHDTTKNFNKDWGLTQQTISQQSKELEGSLSSLGVVVGDELVPKAMELVGTLKEVFYWFGENKEAAKALEYTIGGVLAVAVGTYAVGSFIKLANSIKAVGSEYTKLQNYFRSGFGSTKIASPAVEITKAGVTAGEEIATSMTTAGAQVAAEIRGAMVTGGILAAGEEVAAIRTGIPAFGGGTLMRDPATGRIVGASGASGGLKPSEIFSGANAGETAIVGGGLMASVKGAIGGLLANAMKGGMIAGLGVIGSQIAGGAIGGKTGKDVSSIGSPTAIGAGIGTVIAPGLGTAIGGGLGAVVGVLKAIQDGAAEGIAHHAIKEARGVVGAVSPLENPATAAVQQAQFAAHTKKLHEIEHPQTSKQGFEELFDPLGLESHHKTGDPAKMKAEQKKLGEEAAHIFMSAYGSVKFPNLHFLAVDAIGQLEKIEGPARLSAAKMMISYATTLEKNSQLPKGSVDKLIKSLENQFPQLENFLVQKGMTTAKVFADSLNLTAAETTLKGTLAKITTDFGILPTDVGTTMKDLEYVVAHSTGAARVAAEHDLTKLKDAYSRDWLAIREHTKNSALGVEASISTLSKNLPLLGAPGFEKYGDEVTTWASHLADRVTAGVESTHTGISTINKMLETELSAMGLPSAGAKALATGKAPSSKESFENPFPTPKKHATGGLIQVGKAGERGHDSVPFNAGGVPIITAPGEQIAVFTGQQQSKLNQKLAGEGGLTGFFAGNKTPHHMASGGFVADPGTNFTVGQEPQIVADLRKLSAVMKETIYGISGYRSPSHSVAVGGFSNDPHTRGEAADIGVGSNTLASAAQLTAAILARVGLERPFYPASAHEINHVQLLGSGHGGGGAGGGGGVVGAIVHAAAKQIVAPHVGGKGVLSQITQGALNKVAAAANKKLGSAVSSSGGSGSGGGGVGNFSGPWVSVMAQIAKSKGWSLPAWKSVLGDESGGRVSVKNPTSDAFGLGQLKPENYNIYGGGPGSTGVQQITGMARYMEARYGNPTKALEHENRFHWYNQGGLVSQMLATGGVVKAPTKKKISLPKPHKVKNVDKGKPPSPAINSMLHRLGTVPGMSDLTGYEHLSSQITDLADIHSMLSNIGSLPEQTFLKEEDIAEHLHGVMLPGQTPYTAGMTIAAAKRMQEVMVAKEHKNEAATNPLTEQGEILSWLDALPSHHLITGSDVANISGLAGQAGLSGYFTTGMPQATAAEGVFGWEINKNERLQVSAAHLRSLVHNMGVALKKRQAQIKKAAEAEMRRATKIKNHIKKLTTGTLKQRLAAAEDKASKSELIDDAGVSAGALKENISEEKKLPKGQRNDSAVVDWESQLHSIQAYQHMLNSKSKITSSNAAVQAAHIAVEKNALTNELSPITEKLHALTGSSSSVGTGGQYGVETKNLARVEGAVPTIESTQQSLLSKIPELNMGLESLRIETNAAGLRPAPLPIEGSGENQQESALNALLKQQVQQLRETLNVQTAQRATIANFESNLPHYKKGGPILQDGPIYAHKREYVVPEEGALVMNGGGTQLHHTTVVAGDMAGLIKIIDSRITHPDNVIHTSRIQQRRSQSLPGYMKVSR